MASAKKNRLSRVMPAGRPEGASDPMTSAMPEEVVQREDIIRARHGEDEDEERQTWDDVGVEFVEEVFQEVAVGHDHEDRAQGEDRRLGQQSEDDQPPRRELDVRDREPEGPEEPRGDPAR